MDESVTTHQPLQHLFLFISIFVFVSAFCLQVTGMAPREEIVSSAVSFLQDPSVASSPLDKRIEFLKSKNLTQEEIDLSLARAAGEPGTAPNTPANTTYYPPSSQYQRPPPPNYNYPYNSYGQWQPPPPEVPKRDWRDWFIMATVVGGAGYGLYVLAQRYVIPLVAPPTPPQLEQDKAAIDGQFNKAFALLDTLSSDTTALKEAEEKRTERLDTAITDIEAIVADLKAANARREDDARRMETEIKGMKDSLPRAIDAVRDGSERQLKELSTELGSLKLLMGNRFGGSNPPSGFTGSSSRPPAVSMTSAKSGATTPASEVAPGSSSNATGVNGSGTTPSFAAPASTYPAAASTPASTGSSAPKPPTAFPSGSKASIPAWQMAAQNKARDASTSSTTTNGTPQDGADAVAALTAS